MLSDEEIREIAIKNAEILQGYLNDSDGWHVAKKLKDIVIEYKRSVCPGFEHGYLYRGQTEYSCSKEIVFKYTYPFDGVDSLRAKWDKDIKSFTLLKQLDPNTQIVISTTNSAAKGLISPREFTDVLLKAKTDSCLSSNSVSIESDEFPPNASYVRGFNHPCGFMCLSIPEKPDSTRLVTFIQPDVKGMLPRSLIDAAIPKSMVGFFNNLRAVLKKDGHITS